ncbi:hypothetical protein HRI_002400800 [Hibiscus trionum]|uniref:Retrotransposon gag domain-containing protein n=1 Tax=Hibiscus trionum TaxID=183268 RepID=A0A9W7HZH0_HIBTR|nr:hypothetical protein HRI_002400800 [Hibiscus trionum]
MSQGDSSVSSYFTRLKLLWDEYASLVPFSSCDCDASQQKLKHVQQQRLFQFLNGLNDTYDAIRSQLLLMQPLPSVNQAYSMVVQEESQRLYLSGVSPVSDSMAMFSSALVGSNSRRHFSGSCDHCGVKGHKRDQCYRLISFPPD